MSTCIETILGSGRYNKSIKKEIQLVTTKIIVVIWVIELWVVYYFFIHILLFFSDCLH